MSQHTKGLVSVTTHKSLVNVTTCQQWLVSQHPKGLVNDTTCQQWLVSQHTKGLVNFTTHQQ